MRDYAGCKFNVYVQLQHRLGAFKLRIVRLIPESDGMRRVQPKLVV
eukprot:SAG25_NODE_11958_length_291_cov_0.786458_1_plen_45_part_10